MKVPFFPPCVRLYRVKGWFVIWFINFRNHVRKFSTPKLQCIFLMAILKWNYHITELVTYWGRSIGLWETRSYPCNATANSILVTFYSPIDWIVPKWNHPTLPYCKRGRWSERGKTNFKNTWKNWSFTKFLAVVTYF